MTPDSISMGHDEAETEPGLRRAALLLHGVDRSDREWLLSELAAAQRSQLERLLGELVVLGVPASPELIDDLLSTGIAGPGPTPSPESDSIETLALRLTRLPAGAVAAVLHHEPDALVARTLALVDGPWGRRALLHLGASKRRRIEELWRADGPEFTVRRGHRIDRALLGSVLARSADTARIRRDPAPFAGAARLVGSVRDLAHRVRSVAEQATRSRS